MKNAKLSDLLVIKLSSLYDIESALVKALPKMAKAADDPELKKGLADHWEETKGHAERLEKVFELLNLKPKKLKVEAIRGLIADGDWVIKNIEPPAARDVSLIRAAQHVEHYEMAIYRGAVSWATTLGFREIAALLQQNLKEEMAADEKLEMARGKLDPLII
jgi:ferritin-like metal-binding protein YciE